MVDDEVGAGRDLDRLLGERDRAGQIAARREHLGARHPPGDRGLEVLARELLARRGHLVGLVDVALGEQRAARAARRPGPRRRRRPASPSPSYAARSGAIAACGSPAISSTIPANSSVCASPWRRPSSSSEARAEASIERETSKRPRSASSTAWHRFDAASTDGRRGGDAQQAHDVEAAAAGARHRARAEERGVRRGAEHRGDAAAVVGARAPRRARGRAPAPRRRPGRGARAARRAPGGPWPGPTPSPSSVSVSAAALRLRVGGDADPRGSVRPTSCAAKHAAHAASRGSPAARPAELLHERPRRGAVAGREQALAPIKQQLGPRRGVGLGEQGERTRRSSAPAAARSSRPSARCAAVVSSSRRAGRDRHACVVDVARARGGTGRPARSGTRSPPRARRSGRPRCGRSTRRPARAARRAWS